MDKVQLSNIGFTYVQQGRYEEAVLYFRQSLAASKELGNRLGEARATNNIGATFHLLKRYAEAVEYLQRAQSMAEEVGDQLGEAIALSTIGLVHQEQGQNAKALDYYEKSMDIFESLRVGSGSDSGRSAFIAQFSDLYAYAVNLYIQQNLPEKAFETSERGRARTFLDSLATGYVELNDNVSANLYAQEQETYAARRAAEEALIRAKVQNPSDPGLIRDLQAQFEQAEGEHRVVLDTLVARDDNLTELVPGLGRVLSVSEVQAMLDDQTTVLSFWMEVDQTTVFIISDKTFDVVALPIAMTDLDDQIQDFRSFANTSATHPGSAIALYQMLIEPLKPYLKTPHLAIVPHSYLHYLPFAALTDGTDYLIDDYTITYLPSVTSWKYIRQNAGKGTNTLLVLGNPTTDTPDLTSLPYAESESKVIASLYGAIPLLGKDATESAVRANATTTGILHLAAHGTYNPSNPLYSTIYLAPDGQNDGRLETHEIYSLSLKDNDLVVLSSCETQLGALTLGDEVVGLTRAFFYAGSPTVMASLWAVDDRATEQLMSEFYTRLRTGMSKGEALRQAQIEVRSKYPNPYYWAAFVLNGNAAD